MPAFSLSIRRYATNEAGCWARFTFSGGWAEIAEVEQQARREMEVKLLAGPGKKKSGISDPAIFRHHRGSQS
jgi:hypothetical protein